MTFETEMRAVGGTDGLCSGECNDADKSVGYWMKVVGTIGISSVEVDN